MKILKLRTIKVPEQNISLIQRAVVPDHAKALEEIEKTGKKFEKELKAKDKLAAAKLMKLKIDRTIERQTFKINARKERERL